MNWDFSNLYTKHQQNGLIKNSQLILQSQQKEFTLNTKSHSDRTSNNLKYRPKPRILWH
ncbi:Hypothetical protein BN2458_PEG0737 [Helicobacter typhlonius]|uniref:Uncharacterized protein n=1 Tax=Helicobacter typhlonius TaxID=76936 RepID=A0A0S4PVD7_9HELI|nr:Hypothetical protein BN2458_PEG0737 [Helicobacter typhlonius]